MLRRVSGSVRTTDTPDLFLSGGGRGVHGGDFRKGRYREHHQVRNEFALFSSLRVPSRSSGLS